MSAVSKKLMPRSRARAEVRPRRFLAEHPGAPRRVAVAHAAEGEARDFEAGAAETRVLHVRGRAPHQEGADVLDLFQAEGMAHRVRLGEHVVAAPKGPSCAVAQAKGTAGSRVPWAMKIGAAAFAG